MQQGQSTQGLLCKSWVDCPYNVFIRLGRYQPKDVIPQASQCSYEQDD